ncbi:MAG TPA: hypothetical protein VGI28_17405, partial [Stellaceae bacterium]
RVDEDRLCRLDVATTAPAWPGDGRVGLAREMVRGSLAAPESIPVRYTAHSDEMIRRAAPGVGGRA